MSKDVALVIGGGAFGTSMANVLGNSFSKVHVQVRSKDVYDGIRQGENKIYLPGKKLGNALSPFIDWEEIETDLGSVGIIILGLPTSALRPYFSNQKNFQNINEI